MLQIKTKIVSCHAADSKPVKEEVNGTVILPPLVFLAQGNNTYCNDTWPNDTLHNGTLCSALSKITLCIMTLSIMTLSIMKLSFMTVGMMTLNVEYHNAKFCYTQCGICHVYQSSHYAECRYAEGR